MLFSPSMWEASYSHVSRTSSSVNVSPLFCSDLTCPGEISKSINDPIRRDGACPVSLPDAASRVSTEIWRAFRKRAREVRAISGRQLARAFLSKLRRTSQRSQTNQRGNRPESASSNSSGAHIGGRNVAPQRQTTADHKID